MLENEIFHLLSVKCTGSGWQKVLSLFGCFGVFGHADDEFWCYFSVRGYLDALNEELPSVECQSALFWLAKKLCHCFAVCGFPAC